MANASMGPGAERLAFGGGGGSSAEISKHEFVRLIRDYDPTVRTAVAGRAFNLLWLNAIDTGLEVRCGFTHCRGRLCRAPHYINTASFRRLDAATLLAAHGAGISLVILQLVAQDRL